VGTCLPAEGGPFDSTRMLGSAPGGPDRISNPGSSGRPPFFARKAHLDQRLAFFRLRNGLLANVHVLSRSFPIPDKDAFHLLRDLRRRRRRGGGRGHVAATTSGGGGD
jgi:hypothetical protein